MTSPFSRRSFRSAMLCVTAVLVTTGYAPNLRAQEPPTSSDGQSTAVPVLPKGKKLILKDGSFHLVREYQLKDDRVRYYSVERSDWEEIPSDLVDWEATKKAEADEAQREKTIVEKIRVSAAADRAAPIDIDASIEAAPGVFLPPGEGVFVLDGKGVFPLSQNAATLKTDKGRILKQILVPIPVVPSRKIVQVPGKSAKFRVISSQPEFYMRTTDAREPEMELIRAKISGDARQIEYLDILFKQEESSRKTLPLQRWQVAKGVYRFTLGEPLEPGEYALAEIVPKEGMNFYVWDFGVDPPRSKN